MNVALLLLTESVSSSETQGQAVGKGRRFHGRNREVYTKACPDPVKTSALPDNLPLGLRG